MKQWSIQSVALLAAAVALAPGSLLCAADSEPAGARGAVSSQASEGSDVGWQGHPAAAAHADVARWTEHRTSQPALDSQEEPAERTRQASVIKVGSGSDDVLRERGSAAQTGDDQSSNDDPENEQQAESAFMPESGSVGPPFPDTLDLGDLVLRLSLATGAVLLFGIVAIVVLKKWMPKVSAATAPAKRMKLVESLVLPGRCSVQLVELDGNQVLVGMDAGGIRTIVPVAKPFSASLEDLEQQAETATHVEAVRTVAADERAADETESDPVAGLEAISSRRVEIDELLKRTARLITKPASAASE